MKKACSYLTLFLLTTLIVLVSCLLIYPVNNAFAGECLECLYGIGGGGIYASCYGGQSSGWLICGQSNPYDCILTPGPGCSGGGGSGDGEPEY